MSKMTSELKALTDDLPADRRAEIETAIASSPHLQQQMLEEVRAGRLAHIELLPRNATEGGHYDSTSKTIRIDDAIFIDPPSEMWLHDRIVYVLGHETAHSDLNEGRNKAMRELSGNISRALWTDSDTQPLDATAASQRYLDFRRWDESIATVEGWNALASRIEQGNGGHITEDEILKRAASFSRCVVDDGKGLAEGVQLSATQRLVPDLDPSIRDPHAQLNASALLSAVADCHFDLLPKQAQLGRHGNSDYANTAGVTVIEAIASNVRAFEQTSGQRAPDIHLDFNRLGLKPELLESNGLKMGGQNLVLIDTSHGKRRGIGLQSDPSADPDAPDIERAIVQQPSAPVMSEPGHPAHTMWTHTLHALRTSPNIPAGTFTQHEEQQVAASLVAQSLSQDNPFKAARIDHVVLSKDGASVFAVQGGLDDPAQNLARLSVQQALAAPIEQSSEVAQKVLQNRQQSQAEALTQQQELGPDTRSGPVMRIGPRSLSPSDGPNGSDFGGNGGGD